MKTNSQRILIYFYLYFSAAVLLTTAAAKLFSATEGARILLVPDPIFGVSIRSMFWMVGSIEIAVALACLFVKRIMLRAVLLAWLSTGFIVYRVGLFWVGFDQPCPCLGTFRKALHVSPELADNILKVILAYLVLGSYGMLFLLWKNKAGSSVFANFKKQAHVDL